MSTISFGGLASGIDSQSIVSQLMNVERAPERLLQKQQVTNNNKISEFQKIEDALTSLQTVVKGFNTPSTFSSLTSSVANTSVLTATSTASATPGTHTVQVTSLATNQRQVSTGVVTDSNALVFSSGTFTIDDGSGNPPTTVTIDEGQNSLQGIASAINGSGAQVSASIINDGTNYRLVISGKDTKNYTVDFSGLSTPPVGGTGALAPQLLGPPDPTYQAGGNAQFVVDGISMTATSNTVTDAIQGVTLNLLTGAGATTKVTVATDTSAVSKKINDFVAAYNTAVTLLNSESKYNADKKSAGVLSGDATVRTIQQQLRSLLTTTISGATGSITNLAALGINSDSKTGTLSVDATKLSSKLSSNYNDVVDYFSHNGDSATKLPTDQYGVAQQFNLVIESMVHTYVADGMPENGSLEVRKKALTNANAEMDKRISAMEDRIQRMQTAMLKQYNAMELMVSNLKTQGNSLLSILGSSSKSNNE